MGSNSFLGVLALMIFFGLINSSLNERDRRAEEDTYGYIKYSTAREIGRSSINIALKKLSDSSSITSVSGNLDGGTYNVSISRLDSIMDIVAVAKFSDTTYKIRTKLLVYAKPFPSSRAAVGLHIDTLGSFGLNPGKSVKIMIDGRNYDSSGANPSWTGAVPGVSVLNPYDSSLVKPSDTSKIYGTKDVVIDPNLADPRVFVDEYIANADIRYNADPSKYQTVFPCGQWGTATNPKITYLNGIDSTHQLKVNGVTNGWGVLVLKGNIWFNGSLEFHGLVVLYGDSQLDFDDLGNAKIIGSLLMGGANGSTFKMNGSAQILYSSDALRDAQYIGKLLAYHILDWYE